MKKQMTLTTLALCSGLMAGPTVASDLNYRWKSADCFWAGGCRYTYQVPKPPAGKKWELHLWTNEPLNDDKAWINSAGMRVAAGRVPSNNIDYQYVGTLLTGGEIEFWMPWSDGERHQKNLPPSFAGKNNAYLEGMLVDR